MLSSMGKFLREAASSRSLNTSSYLFSSASGIWWRFELGKGGGKNSGSIAILQKVSKDGNR